MKPMMRFKLFPVKDQPIHLIAVGDISYSGLLNTNNSFSKLYSKEVLDILHDKDISIVNLECPLTTKFNPILKGGPHLCAHPDTIEGLKIAKFDLAVLANNHIMDHGELGMYDTVTTCQKANIKTLGVGPNLEEASRPLFITLNGRKLAFLAFAEEEESCATETTSGAAKLDLANAGNVIRETRKNADMVIVSVHGGNEFYPIPSPRMQRWYRFLVDCGADVVIGHHPHIVHGIEIYQEVPIIYSLGNFYFHSQQTMPKCWYQGLIVKLIISNNKISTVEVFPIEQIVTNHNTKIDIMKNQASVSFNQRFSRLTQIAHDTNQVKEFWKCFCIYRKKYYFNVHKMGSACLRGDNLNLIKSAIKNINIGYLVNMLGDVLGSLCQRKSIKKQNIINLLNSRTCIAHHEAIISIFKMEISDIMLNNEIQQEFNELIEDSI